MTKDQQFSRMYDVFYDRVYRYFAVRTGNRSVAEELTSDVFFKAWRHFSQFAPEKGGEDQWIFGITKNCFIDHLRRRKPDVALEDVEQTYAKTDWKSIPKAVELTLAFEHLTKEEIDLLLQVYIEGFTSSEVAFRFQLTAAAVRQRCARLLKKLRSHFQTPSL